MRIGRNRPRAQVANLSARLKHTIAWCLCDDPYYRPRLSQLVDIIHDGARASRIDRLEGTGMEGRRWGNAVDRRLARWVRKVFDMPTTYWR
jgi:hypothetical protein